MPGLLAIIGADSRPFQRELNGVEAMAKRAGQRMRVELGGATAVEPNSGALREALVLVREISRGNWTRVPGSLSLLISRLGALKYIFNPITAGVVALGIAIFATAKHFITLATEARNLRDILDTSRSSFVKFADSLKQSRDETQRFGDWLKNLSDRQVTLAEKTDMAIRALREQARLQREQAEQHGASETDLKQMDLAAQKQELEILKRSVAEAEKKRDADIAAAKAASANATSQSSVERKAKAESINEKVRTMASIVDKLQDMVAHQTISEPHATTGGDAFAGSGFTYTERPANENDRFDIEVNGQKFGMSLVEARKSFDALTKQESELETTQREIDDLLTEKKKLTEQDVASLNDLVKQRDELANQLELEAKYPSAGLPGQSGRRTERLKVNSLQKVGAYTPPAFVVDVQRKMLGELAQINKNTATLAGAYRQPSVSRLQH